MIMPASGPANPKRRAFDAEEEILMPQALYSAEAEKAVLGCCLAQPGEVLDQATEMLVKEDFFVPAHQEIFAALREMYNMQQAIDVMTIHQWLTDRKLAEPLGSPGILGELLVGFATHLNVGSYIRIVKDKSLLRCLQSACSTIVQDIADMPDSVPSVLDRAEAQIMAVTHAGLGSGSFSRPGDIMDAELARITSYDGRRPIQGIPSGFHKLDELTGGWKAGEMIVLAARPGVGKTTLSLDFMHAAAKAKWDEAKDSWVAPGYSVGMLSLEMPEQQLELRRLSKKSGIPMQQLRIGLTDEKERQILRMAREEMRNWPIVIWDITYLTITQLRSLARRMKKQYAIDMLVIDYLQLVSGMGKQTAENRQNEVAEISRGIKALAKELGIPIIILAQLNRKSAETKQAPALHNLRESGAIEQDADVVLLLHRPDADKDSDGNELQQGPIVAYNLNVAKQRNGPCDELSVLFQTAYARFDDPVRR